MVVFDDDVGREMVGFAPKGFIASHVEMLNPLHLRQHVNNVTAANSVA